MRSIVRSTFRSRLHLTALLASGLVVPLAKADLVTYNISFNTSGNLTASGSYTVTLDPTQTYINATSLVVNSFSDGYTPPAQIGFDYQPAAGFLRIGGLQNDVLTLQAGTDDYRLGFSHITTNPAFIALEVSSTTLPKGFVATSSGSVTVTQVSATPEPSTLSLLGTGVLGAAGAARKRWA